MIYMKDVATILFIGFWAVLIYTVGFSAGYERRKKELETDFDFEKQDKK